MDVDESKGTPEDKSSRSSSTNEFTKHGKTQIIPQRAALLKSILNFFKKAILDSSFSESVRTSKNGKCMVCFAFAKKSIYRVFSVF